LPSIDLERFSWLTLITLITPFWSSGTFGGVTWEIGYTALVNLHYTSKMHSRGVWSFVALLPLFCKLGGCAQPNFLLIVADDLGHADVPWSIVGKQHNLSMPNLQRMKDEGVTILQHYVQPSCAPTRSSLLTGRISNHLGTQNGGWHTKDAAGVSLDEVFLAENLRDAGYSTSVTGKWVSVKANLATVLANLSAQLSLSST
jgi:hypothetical protein